MAESAPAPDPPDAHARAGAGEQDSESPDADISAVPPWEDSCAASEVPATRPPPGDVSLPEAPQAGPQSQDGGEVVGVFLSDLGRKIFLSEVLRRLRERLYYPPRDASLELREVVRQRVSTWPALCKARTWNTCLSRRNDSSDTEWPPAFILHPWSFTREVPFVPGRLL